MKIYFHIDRIVFEFKVFKYDLNVIFSHSFHNHFGLFSKPPNKCFDIFCFASEFDQVQWSFIVSLIGLRFECLFSKSIEDESDFHGNIWNDCRKEDKEFYEEYGI